MKIAVEENDPTTRLLTEKILEETENTQTNSRECWNKLYESVKSEDGGHGRG